MVIRLPLPWIVSIVFLSIWLSGYQVLAAPAGTTVNFTPPLNTAKTIQVTEILWEAQAGSTPGLLHKAGTMTFCIERPNKFRVDFNESNPAKPLSYYISDGQIMVSYDGKQLLSQPTASAEWPFPMMGLLNDVPGPVSAVPAIRDGKKILLAVQANAANRNEYWFDPKTHLLIRWGMFLTWQGKTSEVMRTNFSGWVLNKPLSPAVFRVPSPGANDK